MLLNSSGIVHHEFKGIFTEFENKLALKYVKLLSSSHTYKEKAFEYFVETFKILHKEILYLKEEDIRAECQKRGYNFNDIQFNHNTNLPKNAC